MIMTMISVGIRDLKAHLSRYLRLVAGGEIVLVTDRGRVVAELRLPRTAAATDLRVQELLDSGTVRPAATPHDRSWASWRGLALLAGSAQAIVDADRGA
jgi:antitoxin (DNA-binding transcriptional repressor) of toxin-antitoxin stability system